MSTPIKVLVVSKSGKSNVYRRVTLHSPTFDAVKQKIRDWVRGEFNVSYTDDEGDVITMDVQAEWEECVRIWKRSGGPVRITATKVSSNKSSVVRDEPEQEDVVATATVVNDFMGDNTIPTDHVTWYNLACAYAESGHIQKALDALSTAVTIHSDFEASMIKSDPDLNPLKDHPRFAEILERCTSPATPSEDVLRKSSCMRLLKSYKFGGRSIAKEAKSELKKLHKQLKEAEKGIRNQCSLKAFEEVLRRQDAEMRQRELRERKECHANGLRLFLESQSLAQQSQAAVAVEPEQESTPSEPAPPTPTQEPPQPFREQLSKLNAMGFTDELLLTTLLCKHDGHVQSVVHELLLR